MDYEFLRTEQNEALAIFSSGHEAIGHFLSAELGSDQDKCNAILGIISKLENKTLFNHHYEGRFFQLNLTDEGIEVRGTSLAFNDDEELQEGMNFYDQEQQAECGLQDFKSLLKDWIYYLSGSN